MKIFRKKSHLSCQLDQYYCINISLSCQPPDPKTKCKNQTKKSTIWNRTDELNNYNYFKTTNSEQRLNLSSSFPHINFLPLSAFLACRTQKCKKFKIKLGVSENLKQTPIICRRHLQMILLSSEIQPHAFKIHTYKLDSTSTIKE